VCVLNIFYAISKTDWSVIYNDIKLSFLLLIFFTLINVTI